MNLALSSLPSFAGVSDRMWLSGRVHLGPGLDYLERAFDHVKYGEISRGALARRDDPFPAGRVPRAIRGARGVDLRALRAVSAAGGDVG